MAGCVSSGKKAWVVEWYQARGTLRWAARGEVPEWCEVSGVLGMIGMVFGGRKWANLEL